MLDSLLQAPWPQAARSLQNPHSGVHIAVMHEPFLSFLLQGRKTVESRFSKHAIAPYRKVTPGDIVFLKAGPIVGCFTVTWVKNSVLNHATLGDIRKKYAHAICAEDDTFWEAQTPKRYSTLIGVGDVKPLAPFYCSKRDRRGWVTLREAKSLHNL
jgi:hypothetical protein